MDFSAFLWDTSDIGASQVTYEHNIDDDVIIIEPDNDMIESPPSSPESYTYEY